MKKILLFLALLFPAIAFNQVTIDLDKTMTGDSTFQSIDLDTLFFARDSTYITNGADSMKFVVDDTEVMRLVDVGGDGQAIFDPNGDFGSAAAPSVAFGGGNTGFYESVDNTLIFTSIGSARASFDNTGISGITAGSYKMVNSTATTTLPTLLPRAGDINSGIGHPNSNADTLSLIVGGVEGIRIAEGGGEIKVIITDTLNIPDLASNNTVVFTPTSTGNVDTLETTDLATADITVTGDWTFDNIVVDTITLENGATIQNGETDTLTLTETVVKIEGDLFVTGATTIEHSGGLVYVSTLGTQTIGTGGTFERLNEGAIAYTADHLADFTHDDGRMTYTGTITKHFKIGVNVTIESDEVAALLQIRLAKGGSTIAGTTMQRDFTAQNTDGSWGFCWILELATNEYLEVFGTSDTNGDTFVLHNLTMCIGEH